MTSPSASSSCPSAKSPTRAGRLIDFDGHKSGWDCRPALCDSLVSNGNSNHLFYGWPAPLKRGDGTTQGVKELVIEGRKMQ